MGNKITRRRPAIDERFTRPQGLYPHRDVDHRKLRKLILDAKLAPCYPGAEEPAADLEECPICFLHYPSLNRSKCCAKGICTECFLQMKSPHVSRPTQCPFCKTPNYAVEYRGAKTMEEKGVEQAEEQKVIEAKIRMRQQELQDEEERVQRREDGIRDGIVSSLPSPPATPSNIHGAFPVTLNDAEVDAATVIDAVTVGGREPRARGTNGRPVGTPQPGIFSTAGLFATPSVAVDPDSLWFRASQRTDATDLAGGLRQPMLASTNLPSMPISSSNSLGSNSGGMGSMGVGPGGVLGPVTGLRGGGPTYARFNRDEDFDLDLEDIMVMEAIWLSIQEQGPQRHSENESNVAPENVSSVVSQITARHQDSRIGDNELPSSRTVVQSADSREPLTRRNSVTGGLAGAIAALAERQVAGGGSGDYVTSSQVFHTADSVDSEPAEQRGGGQVAEQEGGLSSAGTAAEFHSENAGTSNSSPYSLHRQQGPAACERGSETEAWLQASQMHETGGLADWRGGVPSVSASDSHCGIHMREGSADQGGPSVSVPSAREGCGVGSLSGVMNDFSSHPANVRTSSGLSPASEPMGVAEEVSTNVLPEASGETGSGAENMVPESFEEQMMLAMALSLAEAQARDGRDDERGAQL